jgi:N-formylglutamate amidohydrolase
MDKDSRASIFHIERPPSALPLVYDSPHSGRDYPDDFRYACDFNGLRRAEDNHVDELFAGVTAHGGTLLCALFPRTYIDVNRAADDIDPELLPAGEAAGLRPTDRSHAGIGLVRRLLRPGQPVYNRLLSLAEVRRRIERCYFPYHEALEGLIAQAHYNFGQVWHINCHSMPSSRSLSYLSQPTIYPRQPDFVLGDRDGTTCDPAFTRDVRDYLETRGFRVAINNPYKGVELVRRHANPARGRHSLQVEINKALYWNEERGEKSRNFNKLKSEIDALAEFLAAYAGERLIDKAAD